MELLREYLKSDVESSKANIYILLKNMVLKYKNNESFSKRIITSYDDGVEGLMDDEDEVMLEFNNQNNEKESELLNFVKNITGESIAKEIEIPHEDH